MSSLLSLRTAAITGTLALLAACNGQSNVDVSQQFGPEPDLPEPEWSLWPDLKVAEVVGWQDGQAPTVPEGLAVTAYATDLANPRTVHTLPNGDVLVVQSKAPPGKPLNRPKDFIRGIIMSMAAGGGGGKETNLITLLRDTNRDGTVDERTDLLTGLTSPFGVPLRARPDRDNRRANHPHAAARRTDQPSLDQGSGAESRRAGPLCLRRLQL
jgi:glucose/arabinose dehydrogenase